MTSKYAQNSELSQITRDAYQHFNRSADDRLNFYYYYLQDVVPRGATVHYIPSENSNTRRALELRTHTGLIWMYGLTSMEPSVANVLGVTGDEAFTKYEDGEFVKDGQFFKFFVATTKIRWRYCVYGVNVWQETTTMDPRDDNLEEKGTTHPIENVDAVARLLKNHYAALHLPKLPNLP